MVGQILFSAQAEAHHSQSLTIYREKKSINHGVTLDRELGRSLSDEPFPRGNSATMDIERHGF